MQANPSLSRNKIRQSYYTNAQAMLVVSFQGRRILGPGGHFYPQILLVAIEAEPSNDILLAPKIEYTQILISVLEFKLQSTSGRFYG